MRLTLRTLLSYLDDTLEPSQAKVIGAKAAESEQARELMERIKQVTRRRRLMAPATSGPGGMDPNTIAEYLDNEVSAEKSAEVEQICLASDVHLAEVAACHQILTLVLGEPALIPSSAKKRMYALVKGPEAIHAAKPHKPAAKPDNDLSSEIEADQDGTLRLGVPALRGKTDYRNLWILVGGATLAACLLIVAVWQLVRNPLGNEMDPKGEPIALNNDAKEIPKTILAKEEIKKPPQEDIKQKDPIPNIEPPKTNPEKKGQFPQVEVVPVKIEPVKEMEYLPASLKQMPVGQYIVPDFKEPGALLQMKPDKTGWLRVQRGNLNVFSARPLVSLSGSKCRVALDSGIELLLWGNLPEVTLDPQVLECEITVHVSAQLDADLTLLRGRLIIKNTKPDDRRVRVRFDNPTLAEENYLDIVLQGQGAAVAFERFSELDQDEPFFEDKKDPLRNGPTATLRCYAIAQSANIRFGHISYTIDRDQQPLLQWGSRKGVLGPPSQVFLPYWLTGRSPLKKEQEEAAQGARKNAVKAHEYLVSVLDTKLIDVALAEADATAQQAANREILMDKRISPETFALWRHVIRCSASIDNVASIFDEFSQEATPLFIRGLCMQTLHSWLGLNRENDYVLLDVLRKNYRKTESIKVMELFHKITKEDERKPVTYQRLIEGLNNDLLPFRALCHWHLFALVPAGRSIPYDPAAPRQIREAAIRAWTQLIPPGQLPPMDPPMKKGKSAIP